jgi:hypothetical protein
MFQFSSANCTALRIREANKAIRILTHHRSYPLDGTSAWQENGLPDSGPFQVIDFGSPRMQVNIEHRIPPTAYQPLFRLTSPPSRGRFE